MKKRTSAFAVVVGELLVVGMITGGKEQNRLCQEMISAHPWSFFVWNWQVIREKPQEKRFSTDVQATVINSLIICFQSYDSAQNLSRQTEQNVLTFIFHIQPQ